jgi:CubicO group peptidase (beta-lactamase class C family)
VSSTRSRLRVSPLVPLLLAVASSAEAQVTRPALVARLDSLAGAAVAENRTAGLSVAVVHGQDTLLLKGYGKANIELNQATPDRAVYEIGSITKQFTAAAILQLRDEGKLSLDDDLTKYLPSFPTRGRHIPIRRLLDHTSGIKGDIEFRTIAQRGGQDSIVAAIGREPFEFTTGDAMIYSNSGFILLGHVIEKASGMSYERYVEDRIFGRLGMKDSRYCNTAEVVPGRTAGYQGSNLLQRAPDNDHRGPYSAGSLCSSAGDLVTWLHALHGGEVMSPPSYQEMTTPSRLNDGTPLRYGFGLSVDRDVGGARVIGHGGGIAGFASYSAWYPDAQLAVVVLMNSIGAISPQAIASELAAQIIPRTPPPATRPYTGTDAASLIGIYVGPSRGSELVVQITQNAQGMLMASANGAAAQPMPWIEGWTFGRDGGAILTFVRNETAGPATALRFDAGGVLSSLKRVQDR